MLLALAGLALAADPAPSIPFEKYTLPNGLEVVLSHDARLPLVAVDIWYHVGAGYELPGRSGFAHLFEHIMFQGSRNVPEDQFFPILEGVGAPFVNGTTDFDRTNYLETVPSNQLELALWLESDRMGFLLDTLTQERLDNQKAVVRKERQQSTENVPYGVAEEQFFKLLFPAPHPYNGVVIGSHQDLEAATLDDVKAFFRTWYLPNNATLVICGDFEAQSTKALVEKYFGSIPSGAEPIITTQLAPPISSEKRLSTTDDVELPKLYMGWVSAPAFKPGDAELQLAASILADGKSSRLHRELVEKKQIAQSVKAYQYPLTFGSVFVVEVIGKKDMAPARLEAEAWAVVEAMRKTPPTQDELSRAWTQTKARVLRGLEELGGFSGKADVLNYYNHHVGDPGYLAADFARYDAVTPEAVTKALSEAIRPDNRVVVDVVPAPKTEGGAQ
ncbi:MAG: insulinase family protein [Deltaproteobacteria bacterium]|nr:insulinase family protein [Deltaproteobacteria bacterium]